MGSNWTRPLLTTEFTGAWPQALPASTCVVVPTVDPDLVTPLTEAFQAVIWHLLVAHPRLQSAPMKWESLSQGER